MADQLALVETLRGLVVACSGKLSMILSEEEQVSVKPEIVFLCYLR